MKTLANLRETDNWPFRLIQESVLASLSGPNSKKGTIAHIRLSPTGWKVSFRGLKRKLGGKKHISISTIKTY